MSGRAHLIPELVSLATLLYTLPQRFQTGEPHHVQLIISLRAEKSAAGGAEAGTQVSQPPGQGAFHQSRLSSGEQ